MDKRISTFLLLFDFIIEILLDLSEFLVEIHVTVLSKFLFAALQNKPSFMPRPPRYV